MLLLLLFLSLSVFLIQSPCGGSTQGLQQIKENYRLTHRLRPTASTTRGKKILLILPHSSQSSTSLQRSLWTDKLTTQGHGIEKATHTIIYYLLFGLCISVSLWLCVFGSPHAWHSLQHVHILWAGISYWPAPCSSCTWERGDRRGRKYGIRHWGYIWRPNCSLLLLVNKLTFSLNHESQWRAYTCVCVCVCACVIWSFQEDLQHSNPHHAVWILVGNIVTGATVCVAMDTCDVTLYTSTTGYHWPLIINYICIIFHEKVATRLYAPIFVSVLCTLFNER